jgi:N-methylhydantoinase A/oxoprolinase/acetone carboxylase beta subunit
LKLGIGIDAGGTYTDAVLLDLVSGQVRRAAKALTTPHDLSVGMAQAIKDLGSQDSQDVRLVSISTTLATNAIVEGHGGRVGLLLIGYDQDVVRQSGLARRLPVEGMRYVAGGHDVKGDELNPLDTQAARQAILEFRDRVDAFAVSGYFGVMNPEHELRVRQMVSDLTAAPVVCGHELTSQLNALKRVSTAVLNARLLPMIQRLLDSVKKVLAEQGISAPLMVVKGDGSLMSDAVARQRPVETILSGPAASAIGAEFLSGLSDAIVVDMGGTTTDIAILQEGLPWNNPAGATVGGWQTSVQAADLRTIGMGGDSHIRVAGGGSLRIGPRRAIPLCRIGAEWPQVVRELQGATHAAVGESDNQLTDFITLVGAPDGLTSESEKAIIHALSQGPMTVPRLCRVLGNQTASTERLEALGVLRQAGLTPTDILWSESSGVGGNGAAARAGAQVVARQLGVPVSELARQVLEQVVDSVAKEVLDKLVADRTGHSLFPVPRAWAFVLEQSLRPADAQPLSFQMQVHQPIVAIGAPVKSFMPRVADKLHTRCVIPPHAEVGNAVGAIVAGVTHVVQVLVQPHVQVGGTVTFLIHSARGRQAADSFAEAVAQAEAIAIELAQNAVREAGAEVSSVKVDRRQVDMGILSEMTVRACATGRPRLAE